LIKSLWDLVCIEVWKAITEAEKMKQNDIYERAAAIFPIVVKNLPDAMYWREKLFSYLPDGTWPTEFHDFISTMQFKDKNMSLAWTKHYYTGSATEPLWKPGFSRSKVELMYFGYNIVETKVKVAKEINNVLNKYWRTPQQYDSGQNTPGKIVHEVIRKAFLDQCHNRAKDNYKSAKCNLMTSIKEKEAAGEDTTEAREKLADLICNGFNTKLTAQHNDWTDNYFPSSLLTFILVGLPCDVKLYEASFLRSGVIQKHVKRGDSNNSPFANVRDLARTALGGSHNKGNRRLMRQLADGSPLVNDITDSYDSGVIKKQRIEIVRLPPPVDKKAQEEARLEKARTILQERLQRDPGNIMISNLLDSTETKLLGLLLNTCTTSVEGEAVGTIDEGGSFASPTSDTNHAVFLNLTTETDNI
jgi:hypothetical protein